MRKATDSEFNEIVYNNILPEIARAFCSLKKEVTNNSLATKIPPETARILEMKGDKLKEVLSNFIDNQTRCEKTME